MAFFDGGDAAVGGLGVEVDRVVRVGQGRVEIGGPAGDAGLGGELLELGRVAADQDRVGHDDFVVADLDAALLDDGHDRAHEVLVGAHASGDAVHDDADLVRRDICHESFLSEHRRLA